MMPTPSGNFSLPKVIVTPTWVIRRGGICTPPESTCDPNQLPTNVSPVIYHPLEIPEAQAPYCVSFIDDLPSYGGVITSYFVGGAHVKGHNFTELIYPQFKERRQHPCLKNAGALLETMKTNHRASYNHKVKQWMAYYREVRDSEFGLLREIVKFMQP
jgi:hypothetical protein